MSRLLDDARRILGSGLSAASTEVLWNTCVPSGGPAGLFGEDGRDWLLRISDIARSRLVERTGAEPGAPPDCRHDPLPVLVTSWIGEAAAGGGFVRPGVPPGAFLAAWNDIAGNVCPELALRLAVRSLLGSDHPVPARVYEAMDRQGAVYGYGDFLVSAVEYLVGDRSAPTAGAYWGAVKR
ncbi:hypothetical protein [Kitasatospora arboriphila]|uniref:Glutaminase n=1 Tax=Kitasatospora arboriphila TaxID=258052 RepID=A0ABN1TF05_9ACTN